MYKNWKLFVIFIIIITTFNIITVYTNRVDLADCNSDDRTIIVSLSNYVLSSISV